MQFDSNIPYDKLQGAHVVVGVSGGVDSSVSAAILKEQGLKVTALFMKNWEEDDTDTVCAAAQDKEDAQAVCDKLGIEFKTINFSYEYWESVFEIFLKEYKAGRTPNPDILCNKEIKFKAFLNYALQDLDADFIATGHYARRSFNTPKAHLLRALDNNKDQSYFLHAIGPNVLDKVLFPIGHIDKPQVRQMAKERELVTYQKKDSTGICFIGEKRFKLFLEKYLGAQKGPIVTVDGKEIGTHDGLMFATIGQRKGLHIGGMHDSTGEPWYVVDKDLKNNKLIVAQGHDHKALYSKGLIASDMTFITDMPNFPLKCTCKTRYRQADIACNITKEQDNLIVMFDNEVSSIAPGQSVVFYQDEECLGGAVITKSIKE